MIDTLIFDGEGVVIDTEGLWDRAQEELLRRRNVPYDRAKIKPLLTGRSSLEGAEILVHALGLSDDPHALARERLDIVTRLVDQAVGFVPGFEDFYAWARSRFRTAMATAMDEELLSHADRKLGLSSLFPESIVSLRHVGYRSKPNPDLFLEAARRVGSVPEHCLVIEDAPHGIAAARRAGMVAIGLATTYPPEALDGADLIVSSYEELSLSTIERLAGGFATSRNLGAVLPS